MSHDYKCQIRNHMQGCGGKSVQLNRYHAQLERYQVQLDRYCSSAIQGSTPEYATCDTESIVYIYGRLLSRPWPKSRFFPLGLGPVSGPTCLAWPLASLLY